MSGLIKHGDDGLFIQPNRTISEKEDGTLSGSVIWEGSQDSGVAMPGIGNVHPDDYRLEMIEATYSYLPNQKIQLQASYFGLNASTTTKIISYSGAQNQEAIETHPDFKAFAGDGDEPKNGAQFESYENASGDEYYDFLGFKLSKGEDSNEFTGVSHYLTAGTQVSITYWTSRVPKLKKRMSIVNRISGFTTPPDVVDFLYLDTPYRQVGSFYQVTEQYLGSGIRGWNDTIYK